MFCSTDHRRVLGAHLARARFGAFDNMRDGLKLVEILPDGVLGVQADLARVRAHEAAQEDPPGQHVSPVGLDRLENGDRDLRGLREPIEGEPTLLSRLPQCRTDIHGIRLRAAFLHFTVRARQTATAGESPMRRT